MSRKKSNVKELREEKGGIVGKDRDCHESYGMVQISRFSCNGLSMFGSNIKQSTGISLSIHEGMRDRDEYNEHYFTNNRIIEIMMSPAQFTSMLTNMNTGGTPCTLRWIRGKGSLEPVPESNTIEELKDDLNTKYDELSKLVGNLSKEVESNLKGPIRKANKEAIMDAVKQVQADVSSNMRYLRRCQTEKLEVSVSEAKAEIEASMAMVLHNAGMEHIKVGNVEMTKVTPTLIEESDE